MRIVVDLQGAQTQSRFRGIGKYSLAFVKALARNSSGHELIIVLNGLFRETLSGLICELSDFIPKSQILFWHAPGPVAEADSDQRLIHAAKIIRESFIHALSPDVVHVTSLFEGYTDDAVISIEKKLPGIVYSATLYDLIPYLNPAQYLDHNPQYRNFYLSRFHALGKADILLSISAFTNQECSPHLPSVSQKVATISSAVEDVFRPLSLSESQSADLLDRYSINSRYILYTGGADERKNLPRLIKAFARLPAELVGATQLVLVGKLSSVVLEYLQGVCENCGLADSSVVFTGYVSEEDLVSLYNLCTVFVFPSWHEGFGLPVLEAMCCGVPVIASGTTSIPEVLGDERAYFDPLSEESIALKLAEVLSDASLRNSLREHNLQFSRNFSWDIVATNALSAWQSLDTPGKDLSIKHEWHEWCHRYEASYSELVSDLARTFAGIKLAKADIQPLLHRLSCSIASNEQQLWAYYRSHILEGPFKYRLEGPFDSSYSLAILNRELARALGAIGVDVCLYSTEGPGDFDPDPVFLQADPEIATLYHRSAEPAYSRIDVASRNLYPPRVHDFKAPLNLLHAYGWEESLFPIEWTNQFNRYLHGLMVMSEHVRKVLIDSGVTLPIITTPLGVDHCNSGEFSSRLELCTKSFCFLHISSCFPRKGVDALLQAYGAAFRSADDVTLVIKTFNNPHNSVNDLLSRLQAEDKGYPHVILISADYSDQQMAQLYELADVYVSPSRAEGFGLPIGEAMLRRIPVIATAWGGQLEFCNDHNSWLCKFAFSPAETHFGLSYSVWAEPDVDHLALLMREVYEASEEEISSRIAHAYADISRFTWHSTANKTIDAVRFISKFVPPPPPRIGWVSTWQTRCGIAAYSEYLLQHFPEVATIYAPYESDQPNVNTCVNFPVECCWDGSGNDDLSALASSIITAGNEVVFIQFNYGFFDFPALVNLLSELRQSGIITIITLHSTIDPDGRADKLLGTLASELAQCARVLVHSISDLNRLKDLGLVANVTLIPHGVCRVPAHGARTSALNATFSLAASPIRIACFGFFLPNKGIPELVKACQLLVEAGFNVHLTLLNAEYPHECSSALIESTHSLVATLGLEDHVDFCTDYLPLEQALAELALQDLIVLPYQSSAESSSAAVRTALASGTPVVVTPLSIFDDIRSLVHTLSDLTPEVMAEELATLLADRHAPDAILHSRSQAVSDWIDHHCYDQVSKRLYSIARSLHVNALVDRQFSSK